jgi:hypothetical protein
LHMGRRSFGAHGFHFTAKLRLQPRG